MYGIVHPFQSQTTISTNNNKLSLSLSHQHCPRAGISSLYGWHGEDLGVEGQRWAIIFVKKTALSIIPSQTTYDFYRTNRSSCQTSDTDDYGQKKGSKGWMGVREDREGPSSYRANKQPACSRVNFVCECVGLWVDDKAAQPFPTLFLFTNDCWNSKPEQTNRRVEMPAFSTKITQKLVLHPHLQTSPIFLFLDSTYGEPKKKNI